MNGATALIEMLSSYGVEVIFGVPGDTNVALYVALRDAQNPPRHVTCRDERSAVYMADCYARLTGKPGVAEVPSGAGALYGLPGVAEANKSSVPLILLVNDIPTGGVGRGTLTELPVEELFRPISKRAETLTHIAKLPELVRRAFREATAGQPGAVVLSLPEDILYQTLPETGVSLHVERQCVRAPSSRVRPEAADLSAALDAILQAKRPLILAGGGANRSGAAASITAFAERLNVPVVSTITGQGVIRDDHRLGIGIIGDNGFHPHALWALGRADLVVYVGCRMGSVATMNWQWPTQSGDTRIVQIDLDPETVGNTYAIDFPLVGDAKAVIDAMLDGVPTDFTPGTDGWVGEINERRGEFWKEMEPLLTSDAAPLRPERVIEAINKVLPSPCFVVSDAGTPTPYATRFLRLHDPASKLIIPRFFGGLGYAIPAVIGAWFAAPDRKPVGLFGDGSLGMSAGELETLTRLQVPAVLIHFNNACFGWIKALQRVTDRHHAGQDPERAGQPRDVRANDPTFGVDFNAYDMSKLANVYGMKAFRVETPEALDAALKEAFALDEPVFIDVVVESIADRLPPVFSWLKKVGVDPEAVGVQAAF
ncbi:thiamine pyrophosphate-binding protein [Methylobacterium nonmethylotrophicum]|uniref:Thiamine pyrophosphate-binding protein n=1 Tax=Methylobacterium nonmethylotrophicum TaxID=1141884 RepID=A0A4Z0NGH2_9HYPH|nr:thiamine pyrophosphate-binding protein [Methylobacterium nonmethylotrophicum]TGD95371.1 thiamine pyrophosphate-binding protein [Methylobacterium nonmethylotrophicum]